LRITSLKEKRKGGEGGGVNPFGWGPGASFSIRKLPFGSNKRGSKENPNTLRWRRGEGGKKKTGGGEIGDTDLCKTPPFQ